MQQSEIFNNQKKLTGYWDKIKYYIMKTSVLIKLTMLCSLAGILQAQQPESPLVSSFDEYQEMKETSTLGLEWIVLGPVINSARWKPCRLIQHAPERCMLHLDRGTYGKQ